MLGADTLLAGRNEGERLKERGQGQGYNFARPPFCLNIQASQFLELTLTVLPRADIGTNSHSPIDESFFPSQSASARTLGRDG